MRGEVEPERERQGANIAPARPSLPMRGEVAPDHAIAAVAERQGGVVARDQLVDLGFNRSAIDRRLKAGRLHALHRGVFAVGHRALDANGRRWAAVLAYRPEGVLSHRSAAAAWDIAPSSASLIDVTVGRTGRSRRPGIRLHQTRSMLEDEVTTLDGLPITTPARTLVDLAATGLRGRRLEAALDRAHLVAALDFTQLRALLVRYPRRVGSPALDAVLSRYEAGTVNTRSALEELILELCDAYRLPRPTVNTVIEGRERDFCWPRARLVVEADSYAWHRSPSALDDERERDVALVLAGYRVLRFTWDQVTRRPEYIAGAVLAALDGA
jgi:very-short-patch-repair endonuclease